MTIRLHVTDPAVITVFNAPEPHLKDRRDVLLCSDHFRLFFFYLLLNPKKYLKILFQCSFSRQASFD